MDVIDDLKILLQPNDIKRIFSIRRAAVDKICELSVEAQKSDEPVSFENRADNLENLKKRGKWGGIFDCAWMHFAAAIPEKYRNERLCAVIDVGGEGLIVDENNDAKQGISNPFAISNIGDYFNITPGKTLYLLGEQCENVDFWMDCGYNGILGKDIGCGRLRRADLCVYHDDIAEYYFDYLALAFAKVDYSGREKTEVNRALAKSYGLFKSGLTADARAALKPCLDKPSDSDLTVTAIGHSHLDLAWLWPIRETKRKSARTLSTALKNMTVFDGYIYGASQPQQFEWIKHKYPELYSRVKEAAKNGRFEPQGGMWCECDTNITGAESLVRQFIYGIDFWKKEFGFDVNNCWLPDVFGYTAALPAIMKGCNLKYFMTQKLSWNNINEFPYETFIWQGLSDEKVLTHLLPANTYNSSGAAPSLHSLYLNHKRKDKISEALMLYGAGDGGGGPCEANIQMLKRYKNLSGLPKINFGRACDFFDRVDKYTDEMPKYKGELYLEKHQGTFTTQSNNKKLNRKCEFALHDIEMLGAVAVARGYKYPYDKMSKIWKEIMLYQFHDILPGSSITRVYEESVPRYKKMIEEITAERDKIVDYLSVGDGVSVLNTAPYGRAEYLKRGGDWYSFEAKPYSSAKLQPVNKAPECMRASEGRIENDRLKVLFDNNGEIYSLIDKNTGKEFNGDYLNRLTVYTDKKLFYNAWDIDIDYTKKRKSRFKLKSSKYFTDGPRAVFEAHYEYGHSRLFQKTILYYNKPYIEFDTRVDWHETHKMLRADFIPANYSGRVTCDIQFGNIERSTKTDNKLDWAQFEIPAHKFIDVSDENAGVAILSSSKYGFRAKDGLMSINLLRSPVYPDKTADRGKHHFRYAYYPHEGGCFEAGVSRQAYLFNYAPVVLDADLDITPVVTVDKQNIVVETVKPAENGEGVILRMYENEGKDSVVKLCFGINHDKLYLTDMLENIINELPDTMQFKPYEIKTLLLK